MPGRAAQKKKAIADLIDLLPKLDEEGLAFLLEQARIHLYNMDVERQEREATTAATKAAAGSVSHKRPTAPKGNDPSGFHIERSDDGETYHLVSGGVWKLFTASEMAAMVAVARGKGGEEELARRLHAWLERERRDALADFFLGARSGPSSIELVRVLKKTFSGKKD
jgi:hypothetical protein